MARNDNIITDRFVLPDGREGMIMSGSAYKNYWQYSGFGGDGYLVTVGDEKVTQVAFRFDAVRAARELGGRVVESKTPQVWEMEESAPRVAATREP